MNRTGAASCRPRDHLITAGRLYPDAWRKAGQFHADRGKEPLPDWPQWCYLPIAGGYAIVADDAHISVNHLHLLYPERVADAARLTALATWRMTQGIYRFDPAVYDAIRDTPLSGDIPHEILYRLPEWCVYLETPGLQFGDSSMPGAFAHLEHDVNDGRSELRLLLDLDGEEGPYLLPLPLHLGPWPLTESLSRMQAECAKQATTLGLGDPSPRLNPEALSQVLQPLLSLLVYLCSQAAEMGDGTRRPANPAPKRVKSGMRMFPPERQTTWDVGVRLGAALRRAYHALEVSGEGIGSSPRGHVRRQHWHGFWSGPRDGPRTFGVRWMPPIPVNLDDVDDLPSVIRPVR